MKTALLAAAALIAVAIFANGLPSKETISRLDLPVPVRQTILTALDLLPQSTQPTVDVSFSLGCQVIESEWHKSLWNQDWDGSMEEQELTRGGAYDHGPDSPTESITTKARFASPSIMVCPTATHTLPSISSA